MNLGDAIKARKVKHKLHSKEHLLAEDLSLTLGEPKKFAAYLGVARTYHEEDLRALAKRVAEKFSLPFSARGRYFFAALKGLARKYEFRDIGEEK